MELIVTQPVFDTSGTYLDGSIVGFEEGIVLDRFTSLIWTDRFDAYGDFQLDTNFDSDIIDQTPVGSFVTLAESDRIMIVESHEIKSDPKTGAKLTIKGRSLESLLDRRIVWNQTILEGNFESELLRMITENIVNPTITNRKIINFVASNSVDPNNSDNPDPVIPTLTISAQLAGDNIYTAVQSLVSTNKIGFRVYKEPLYNIFHFQLYRGVDRSYGQSLLDPVIFSPDMENLASSDYVESEVGFRNIALVGGEGQGTLRKMQAVDSGVKNFLRKEMFVNAADISSTTGTTVLTTQQYLDLLTQRGNESLASVASTTTFEGEIEITKRFVYGKDFFMGDIVSVENEYGISAESKVTAIIFSQTPSKISIIPTFTAV